MKNSKAINALVQEADQLRALLQRRDQASVAVKAAASEAERVLLHYLNWRTDERPEPTTLDYLIDYYNATLAQKERTSAHVAIESELACLDQARSKYTEIEAEIRDLEKRLEKAGEAVSDERNAEARANYDALVADAIKVLLPWCKDDRNEAYEIAIMLPRCQSVFSAIRPFHDLGHNTITRIGVLVRS